MTRRSHEPSCLDPAARCRCVRSSLPGSPANPRSSHLPDICGFSEAVLRRGSPLFVHRPERFFASALPAWASVREALVVPFHAQERLVGLMWVLLHDAKRHFEPEDARLLGELAGFAGAAVRLHEGPKAWSRHEKSVL